MPIFRDFGCVISQGHLIVPSVWVFGKRFSLGLIVKIGVLLPPLIRMQPMPIIWQI